MEIKKTLSTQSGMCCVWDKKIGQTIDSYEKWETLFLDDKDRLMHIQNQQFVPININANGAFEFTVRYGDDVILNEREQNACIAQSNTYALYPTENIVVSGIEHIEEPLNDKFSIEIPINTEKLYRVEIYLIDWKAEKNYVDKKGFPKDGALSDFVILIKPADTLTVFYKGLDTFPSSK